MNRRDFLKSTAILGAALSLPLAVGGCASKPADSKTTAKTDSQTGSSKLPFRTLGSGKAAFDVSALGFGVMGMTYNRSAHPDRKQCIRLLHEAADRGVTLFDTAIIYGPLNNEELAGEALSKFKDRVSVTTKFGHEVINGKGTGRQDSRP